MYGVPLLHDCLYEILFLLSGLLAPYECLLNDLKEFLSGIASQFWISHQLSQEGFSQRV